MNNGIEWKRRNEPTRMERKVRMNETDQLFNGRIEWNQMGRISGMESNVESMEWNGIENEWNEPIESIERNGN